VRGECEYRLFASLTRRFLAADAIKCNGDPAHSVKTQVVTARTPLPPPPPRHLPLRLPQYRSTMTASRITGEFVRNLDALVIGGRSALVKPGELESAISRPAWLSHYQPGKTAPRHNGVERGTPERSLRRRTSHVISVRGHCQPYGTASN